MSYYNIEQAIKTIRDAKPDFGLTQLADLCGRGKLTPTAYYYKCLGKIDPNEHRRQEHQVIKDPHTFKGYLTHDSLCNLLADYANAPANDDYKVQLWVANIYDTCRAYYAWGDTTTPPTPLNKGDMVALRASEPSHDERYPPTTYDSNESDKLTVTPDMLRFPADEVEAYANSLLIDDLTTPEQQQRITELESQIADLESQLAQAQTVSTPADSDMLQTIFDDSHEYHAPDLKHAINLWADLYINDKIKGDSHSNKANIWIKDNTGYGEKADTSKTRIREITTPLKDFGGQRPKEVKK